MRMMIDSAGQPVLVDDNGGVIGHVKSINFPAVTMPTASGEVHELNRAGKVIGDVVLQNGQTLSQVELPIG